MADVCLAQSNIEIERMLSMSPLAVLIGGCSPTRSVAVTMPLARLTDFGSSMTGVPADVAPILVSGWASDVAANTSAARTEILDVTTRCMIRLLLFT